MFRPDEGAQLWTYAYKFVLGAISVKARREHSEPARPRDRHDEGQGLYGAYRVLLAMPDADAESPEVAAETRELCALVSDSVLCLSDQERRALGFRFVDELDVRDVAASLGLPRSTASDLLQGALKKLRERLTPWSL